MRKMNHRLAILRFVLGKKTQDQFGKMVGVSGNYIKKIELGQRPMSDSLARAIKHLFGIDGELLAEPVPPPGSMEWNALLGFMWLYTETWQKSHKAANLGGPDAFRDIFTPALHRLVESATAKKRAVALLLSLKDWMSHAQKEFGLPDRIIADFYYGGAYHDYVDLAGNPTMLATAPDYIQQEISGFTGLAALHDEIMPSFRQPRQKKA